jgi:hypothetical protein
MYSNGADMVSGRPPTQPSPDPLDRGSADLSERETLMIRKPKPSWKMRRQDVILGGEVFDLRQQLLIDQSADRRQNTEAFTTFHPRCMF